VVAYTFHSSGRPPRDNYRSVPAMNLVLVAAFGLGCVWLCVTTPEQRITLLGYAIAFAVVMSIASLLTGQGPNSHY